MEYFPDSDRRKMKEDFRKLRQGNRSIISALKLKSFEEVLDRALWWSAAMRLRVRNTSRLIENEKEKRERSEPLVAPGDSRALHDPLGIHGHSRDIRDPRDVRDCPRGASSAQPTASVQSPARQRAGSPPAMSAGHTFVPRQYEPPRPAPSGRVFAAQVEDPAVVDDVVAAPGEPIRAAPGALGAAGSGSGRNGDVRTRCARALGSVPEPAEGEGIAAVPVAARPPPAIVPPARHRDRLHLMMTGPGRGFLARTSAGNLQGCTILKLTTFAEVFDRALWAEHGDAHVREKRELLAESKDKGKKRQGGGSSGGQTRYKKPPKYPRTQQKGGGARRCIVCGGDHPVSRWSKAEASATSAGSRGTSFGIAREEEPHLPDCIGRRFRHIMEELHRRPLDRTRDDAAST
uniref:Uncharacterized protein n=1 Tax=Ananas comosus var. bracteatus TaxID=296719 RepID=A0A6V7PED8_ANACO|nr:unnamed protein product [Ananas comosus var. bracteatus]